MSRTAGPRRHQAASRSSSESSSWALPHCCSHSPTWTSWPCFSTAASGDSIPARAITEREEEILKLVAEGYSSKQIADLLFISVKTVERHRANLLAKLGLRDRLELARYAIRAGLIDWPQSNQPPSH